MARARSRYSLALLTLVALLYLLNRSAILITQEPIKRAQCGLSRGRLPKPRRQNAPHIYTVDSIQVHA